MYILKSNAGLFIRLTMPGRGGTVFSSLIQSRYNTPGRVAFLVPATLQLHAVQGIKQFKLISIFYCAFPSCNMQTLLNQQFNIVAFFAATNHLYGCLRKQKFTSKVMSMGCDWRISIHFVCFSFCPGLLVVVVIMIDSK